MLCARCGCALPPGARHPDNESCLEALKHEVAVLSMKLGATCPTCHVKPLCACNVKRAARAKINQHAPGAAQMIQILGEILKPE